MYRRLVFLIHLVVAVASMARVLRYLVLFDYRAVAHVDSVNIVLFDRMQCIDRR